MSQQPDTTLIETDYTMAGASNVLVAAHCWKLLEIHVDYKGKADDIYIWREEYSMAEWQEQESSIYWNHPHEGHLKLNF